MIKQEEVVEHAYRVLSMELQARSEGVDLPVTDSCTPFCIGCACAQAYRELDGRAFASPDIGVRMEVVACILAAVTQISFELRRPA